MTNYNRIFSIDIMRGIVLFLMLYFLIPGTEVLPYFLTDESSTDDLFNWKTCWIFPGFLFLAGMSVPFSLSRRFSRGATRHEVSRHIFIRFISLLIIGVLILNTTRVDGELTGISYSLWVIAMYAGIFLVWNDYPQNENNFFTVTGLKLIGMALLAFLVFRFKSGEPENDGSLITGWWSFAGITGWSYLVTAFAYLFFRHSILKIALLAFLFLILNVLADLDKIILPDIARSLFGVIIDGHAPFIMLSGLLAGSVIRNFQQESRIIFYLSGMMILYIAAGFIALKTSLTAGYTGTTVYGLLSSGLSLLIFIPLYFIADIKKLFSWAGFLMPAGEYPLTTYLASGLIYSLISLSGIPVFFFKQSENPYIVIGGSLVWALLMLQLPALLVRLNIRPKV